MKYLNLALPIAVLFSRSVSAFLPACAWNDCMGSWDSTNCDRSSGWDCICSNATAIAQINTCVATSCTNATDQEAIFGAIAQLCANNGVTVTNTQEATFSATSGGSLYATITGGGYGPGGSWNSDSWSSWISACSSAGGSAPSGWMSGASWGGGWGGGHGGHWGSGHGPWATKASGIACDPVASWTTWTAGWGPFSSWTGTWSGCSTTTATPSPATITTTISGSVVTGTTFGIQAAAQTSGSGSGRTASSRFSTVKVFGISGTIAATIFALMIAL